MTSLMNVTPALSYYYYYIEFLLNTKRMNGHDFAPRTVLDPSAGTPKPEAPLPYSPQMQLRKRLREAERRAAYLLTHGKCAQLLVLIESMENLVREYYKVNLSVTKELSALRSLNRARKKEEIVLLHNRAVVHRRNSENERSAEMMLLVIEQIATMIQSEQIRYGFLEHGEDNQKQVCMNNINEWKRLLARHYYNLALISFEGGALEIAIAAVMKSLDVIKDLYKHEMSVYNSDNKEKISQSDKEGHVPRILHLQELQELNLMVLLKEKVSFSKYLNIVSVNNLLDLINAIFEEKKDYSNFFYGDMEMEMLIDLELPQIERIVSGVDQINGKQTDQHFVDAKILHFLNFNLVTRIYAEKNRDIEMEYQKLKNTKNIIFIHTLMAYLYERYLPACNITAEIINNFLQMYQIKSNSHGHRRQIVNIHTIVELFGIKIEKLINQQEQKSKDTSIIEERELEKEREQAKLKTKKSLEKSKEKLKEKYQVRNVIKEEGKPSKKKTPNKVTKCKKEDSLHLKNKERIRQEYLVKPKKYPRTRDYLVKALNQNHNISHDCSLSKEKRQHSSTRRHIRTETNINEAKSKDAKDHGRTQPMELKQKIWH